MFSAQNGAASRITNLLPPSTEPPAQYTKRSDVPTYSDRIKEALRNEPPDRWFAATDIAEMMGLDVATIRTALYKAPDPSPFEKKMISPRRVEWRVKR